METIKKFSDFTSTKHLIGKKLKIEDVLNKEIVVEKFYIGKSKHNDGNYLKLQFTLNNETCILNTGSNVLIDQITRDEVVLPFLVTINKFDKYFKFI